MKIFDDHIVTSPVTAPRMNPTRSRVFGDSENRRDSAPAAASNIMAYAGDAIDRKRKRTTNINPFTPTSILATLKKKARMTSGESR